MFGWLRRLLGTTGWIKYKVDVEGHPLEFLEDPETGVMIANDVPPEISSDDAHEAMIKSFLGKRVGEETDANGRVSAVHYENDRGRKTRVRCFPREAFERSDKKDEK